MRARRQQRRPRRGCARQEPGVCLLCVFCVCGRCVAHALPRAQRTGGGPPPWAARLLVLLCRRKRWRLVRRAGPVVGSRKQPAWRRARVREGSLLAGGAALPPPVRTPSDRRARGQVRRPARAPRAAARPSPRFIGWSNAARRRSGERSWQLVKQSSAACAPCSSGQVPKSRVSGPRAARRARWDAATARRRRAPPGRQGAARVDNDRGGPGAKQGGGCAGTQAPRCASLLRARGTNARPLCPTPLTQVVAELRAAARVQPPLAAWLRRPRPAPPAAGRPARKRNARVRWRLRAGRPRQPVWLAGRCARARPRQFGSHAGYV